MEFVHLRTFQQDKRLVSEAVRSACEIGPFVDGVVPDVAVSVEQGPPVAGFGSGGEVSLAEGLRAVFRDAAGGFGILDEGLDLLGEVAEIAFYLDVVLVWTTGDQKVMVMLDVLEFVGDNYRIARLSVLERCGV